MTLLDHIRDDWSIRLPHRVRYSGLRGASRPLYAMLCFLYYLIKALLLICIYIEYRVIKLLVWEVWTDLFRSNEYEYEEEYEEEEEADEDVTHEDDEELPFCQLFVIDQEMSLMVDHVEMCPDETAFIRVVDNDGYTPLYKRKVHLDKQKKRYILFTGVRYYLNDEKTRPTVAGRK